MAFTLSFPNWTFSFSPSSPSFIHKYPPSLLAPHSSIYLSLPRFLSHKKWKRLSHLSLLPSHPIYFTSIWLLPPAPLKLLPARSSVAVSLNPMNTFHAVLSTATDTSACNRCNPSAAPSGSHNAHTPAFPPSQITLYLLQVSLPCPASLCWFPGHNSPVSFTLHTFMGELLHVTVLVCQGFPGPHL